MKVNNWQKDTASPKSKIVPFEKRALKGITDIELLSIPEQLKKARRGISIPLINSSVDNQKQVAEINKRNNEAITKYRKKEKKLSRMQFMTVRTKIKRC